MFSKKKLDVSIILPIYNVEQYLRQCLESLMKIKSCSLEIICVEDCSTDNTKAVLQAVAAEDERIKIIYHEKNKGVSAARNSGLMQAEGEYILFVDPDDYVNAEYFDEIYQTAENNNTDVVFFNRIDLYKNGKTSIFYEQVVTPGKIINGRQYFKNDKNNKFGYVYCYLFRHSFLKENGLWFKEGIIFEDNLYMFEVMMCAEKILFVDKPFYVYRIRRENSITSSEITEHHLYSFFLICVEVFKKWSNICDDSDIALNMKIRERLGIMIRNFCSALRKNPKPYDKLFGNYAEKATFRLLCNLPEKIRYLKKEEIEKIDEKEVFVYGCEKGTSNIIKQLKRIGIKIKAVIVCEPEIYPETFEKYRVLSVNSPKCSRDIPVIVAAEEIIQENVVKFLRKKGYREIIIADETYNITIDERD